jgi:hypothetical protein
MQGLSRGGQMSTRDTTISQLARSRFEWPGGALSYCPRPPVAVGWLPVWDRIMTEKRGTRWTPKEDDLFRRMAEANIRPELIAAKLNRSVHAIKARAYAIGLPLKWFRLKAKGK